MSQAKMLFLLLLKTIMMPIIGCEEIQRIFPAINPKRFSNF
jgi:hypothetical protein